LGPGLGFRPAGDRDTGGCFYPRGLMGIGDIAIGGMVGLGILFLAFISVASMNPTRSLAPALVSDELGSLWLYWPAIFVGTLIIAAALRKKIQHIMLLLHIVKECVVLHQKQHKKRHKKRHL
jgi:hypothetical protein